MNGDIEYNWDVDDCQPLIELKNITSSSYNYNHNNKNQSDIKTNNNYIMVESLDVNNIGTNEPDPFDSNLPINVKFNGDIEDNLNGCGSSKISIDNISDEEEEQGNNNQYINIPNDNDKRFSFRKLRSFLGPAILVSIGYLDPANIAVDVAAGSTFGYSLLWVLLFSNIMALLLQTITIRVSIVTGKDLAQNCAAEYSENRVLRYLLWIICELAIISTDLAEVIGTAIGLQILFRIPLIAGVIITALDTLLFLLIQRFGPRKLELVVLAFLSIITGCFIVELFLCKPNAKDVFRGFVPELKNSEAVVLATGIIGATVMPHNLFLHSGVVQSRKISKDMNSMKQACKYNVIDTFLALNCAFVVNASILMLAAAIFWMNGYVVTELSDAYRLMNDLLSHKIGSILFGIALLLAGQSSTITGTMAGQIVMEGFIDLKIKPWLRRLVTRLLAIIPAVVIILVFGDKSTYQLLIFSQVVLSIALPFTIIPLIQLSCRKSVMKELRSPIWMIISSVLIALFIISLNFMTIIQLVTDLAHNNYQAVRIITYVIIIPIVLLLVFILIWVIAYQYLDRILKFLKFKD